MTEECAQFDYYNGFMLNSISIRKVNNDLNVPRKVVCFNTEAIVYILSFKTFCKEWSFILLSTHLCKEYL